MSSVVESVTLVMSNVGNNNNKVWRAKLYENGSFLAEWGRVGKKMQSKTYHTGKNGLDKKVREKERKGYTKVDVICEDTQSTTSTVSGKELKDIATAQISKGNKVIEKLVDRLVSANVHQILESTTMTYNSSTGLFSTPVGIVTTSTISNARNVLDKMVPFVKDKDFNNSSYIKLLEEYLMYIPQDVGRKLIPSELYTELSDLDKQYDILDSLTASYDMVTSPVDDEDKTDNVAVSKVFDVSLEPVTDTSVINRIKDKYNQTRKSMHACNGLKVANVYTVNIAAMKEAFENVANDIGNIKELWHGTRVSNILSILRIGLIIPKSSDPHVCGRMYGDGLYFSDQSTKSLNYSYGYWGGNTDNNCFMFLCDVAMGKEYSPSSWRESLPKSGYDSTFAKAGQAGVRNNEMIVYNTNQANLTYLVEFKK
jgi:poly [ADP-ribose] polymerase